MLDDLKVIHERDTQDAFGIAEKQYEQLSYVFSIENERAFTEIANIVYSGMGGSALAALLSQTWPGYHVPFEVNRGYELPSYVGKNTLVIVSSYSGNTEETLSALTEAEEKGSQIVVIAGGGQLADRARAKQHALIILPKAAQPRFAVFYNLRALLLILDKAGLLMGVDVEQSLTATIEHLKNAVQEWVPTVPASKNPAKQLAQELMGRSVVIYGGPLLWPAAYKWKISFNENAKNVAWWNQYPEFNHNEFMGWSSHPVDKPYAVIDLKSDLEHPRVQQRFELSDKLLSGKRPAAHSVVAKGETLIQQLLWMTVFGDFVSLYVAILNGVNPSPVDLIEKFKKELGA